MKLAILMQCHKSPKQIDFLLAQLEHPDVDIFIHVDKKSSIGDHITRKPNVHMLPDELRVEVRWGTFSQVLAALNLFTYANKHGKYDYYWQISGQDFPICSINAILEFLLANRGSNFIHLGQSKYHGLGYSNQFDKRTEIYFPTWMASRTLAIRVLRRIYVGITGGYSHTFRIFRRKELKNLKPYFGSCWVCLHTDFVTYLIDYVQQHPKEIRFFRNVLCSDEAFFQTMFMNSPYVSSRKEYLHYIIWKDGASSPQNLTVSDFDAITTSDKLMARKIDGDFALMELLKKHTEKQC